MAQRELAHIGYVVRSMASALKRFARDGAIVRVPPTDDPFQRVTCCLLDLDGAAIELVAPLGDDSPVAGRISRGGGLDHLCFYVDDIDSALAEERLAGGVVVCEPVHAVTFNTRIAFIHRKTGLVVELMERIA